MYPVISLLYESKYLSEINNFGLSVEGTKNVINACFANNIKRLVHDIFNQSAYIKFRDKQ